MSKNPSRKPPLNDSRLPDQSLQSIAQKFSGKKILVTGATGFIGSNLLRSLEQTDCHVIRMTRQTDLAPYLSRVANVQDVKGDIRERAVWEASLEGVDYVFHLAAQTDIALSEDDSYADFNCNVLPLIHLLNICREKEWKPTVLFAGTVTIAGIPKKTPVDESHPDDPLTPYCLHKLTAEKYLKDYVRLGAVKGAILRLSNVYGPGPISRKTDRGVLNKMIGRARAGEPLFLYGNRDRVRDYVFVDDVVRAFLLGAIHIDKINGEHFVIGSGRGHSLEESFRMVAKQVGKLTGKNIRIQYREAPADFPTIESRHFVADPSRFKELTGWQPAFDLHAGIDRTIGI